MRLGRATGSVDDVHRGQEDDVAPGRLLELDPTALHGPGLAEDLVPAQRHLVRPDDDGIGAPGRDGVGLGARESQRKIPRRLPRTGNLLDARGDALEGKPEALEQLAPIA